MLQERGINVSRLKGEAIRGSAIFRMLERVAPICAAAVVVFASAAYAQNARTVLMEEFTGAWCGYCPDGHVTTNRIAQRFGGRVIAVALHNSDAMEIPEETVLSQSALGYPSLIVDRHRFGAYASLGVTDRPSWEAKVEERLAVPSPASVEVDALYDENARHLTVTVRATFSEEVTGELRFNAYVVEDSVVGYGYGYDQSNYYNSDPDHPMYKKGNPAVGYAHRHVVRAMLGGAWGSQGSIPSNVAAGSTHTYTYETTLPHAWNREHISVVGLVQLYAPSTNRREIVNAAERKLGVPSDVEAESSERRSMVVDAAPNPFNERTLVRFGDPQELGPVRLVLYDVMGREVEGTTSGLEPGSGSIEIAGSHLPSGVYRLVVTSRKGSAIIPLVKR